MKFALDRVDIFTTDPGAEVRIGTYGTATNTTPCVVPSQVAQQFAGKPGFRVVKSDSDTDPKLTDDEPHTKKKARAAEKG